MLAPGQSCTDFMPASRSRQTVWSGGSVFSSDVLPTPGGPKIASEVLLFASRKTFVGRYDSDGHQAASSCMGVAHVLAVCDSGDGRFADAKLSRDAAMG